MFRLLINLLIVFTYLFFFLLFVITRFSLSRSYLSQSINNFQILIIIYYINCIIHFYYNYYKYVLIYFITFSKCSSDSIGYSLSRGIENDNRPLLGFVPNIASYGLWFIPSWYAVCLVNWTKYKPTVHLLVLLSGIHALSRFRISWFALSTETCVWLWRGLSCRYYFYTIPH
jgi:hypothetical protein